MIYSGGQIDRHFRRRKAVIKAVTEQYIASWAGSVGGLYAQHRLGVERHSVEQRPAYKMDLISYNQSKLVSIMLCTMDRYDLTVQCVGEALINAGYPFELLSCDNGSQDRRVPEYVRTLNPVFHQLNKENEGYAVCMNQMLLRARGNWFCQLDNDLKLPPYWLRTLVECNEAIPESGISGWHCIFGMPQRQTVNGKEIYPGDVFGVKFYSRRMVQTIGYLKEYGKYGLEDRNFMNRASRSGLLNYYVGGGSIHAGDDAGNNTPYRKFKSQCLEDNYRQMEADLVRMDEEKQYLEPMPAMRWL